MPHPPRAPGLLFSTFSPHDDAIRTYALAPWMFSPHRWRTKQRFTATGALQVHTAGVVVGSEMDASTGRLRRFDVEQGDYIVRGEDDMLAVLTPVQFGLMCVRVRASYGA